MHHLHAGLAQQRPRRQIQLLQVQGAMNAMMVNNLLFPVYDDVRKRRQPRIPRDRLRRLLAPERRVQGNNATITGSFTQVDWEGTGTSARERTSERPPLSSSADLTRQDAADGRRRRDPRPPHAQVVRSEPVPRETLEELFGLALFAPNHHLTQPWRFRVLGPEALARLKEAAGLVEAPKLDRAPTLVVASARLTGPRSRTRRTSAPRPRRSTRCCSRAHASGLASYWRTPAVLRTREGREAIGMPDGERVLGLIHLGRPLTQPPPKERDPVGGFLSFLD